MRMDINKKLEELFCLLDENSDISKICELKEKISDKEITLIVTGAVIKFSEHAPKLLYKLNNLLYPYSIDYIDI